MAVLLSRRKTTMDDKEKSRLLKAEETAEQLVEQLREIHGKTQITAVEEETRIVMEQAAHISLVLARLRKHGD